MENYDEEILENPFFKCLREQYSSLYKQAANHRWIILVPRIGCVRNKLLYTQDEFETHILISVDDNTFQTLNDKEIAIQGNVIKTCKGFEISNVLSILFEETFFNDKDESFRVICIDSPLEGLSDVQDSIKITSTTSLNTLEDCMELLWSRTGNRRLQRHLDEMIQQFNNNYHSLETASLRRHIDEVNSLCLKTMQVVLKDAQLKKITRENKYLLHNIRLATETYVLHGLYKKIFKGISAIQAHDDAELNKRTRNLSDVHLRGLGIKQEFGNNIPKARKELSNLNRYSTPLGKITCLKRIMNAISQPVFGATPESEGPIVVTTDDLLPILAFLIIKSEIPNWLANLFYMKNFQFTKSGNDEYGYYITSVEAAIDYIKQEHITPLNLMNPLDNISLNPLSNFKFDSSPNLEENNNSIQLLFQHIQENRLEAVQQLLTKSSCVQDNATLKLCHPLCSCDICEKIIAKSRADSSVTVFSRDDRGFTALHVASFYGHSDLVEILLGYNAEVNASDYHGSTSLHLACQRGHQRVTLLLMDSGSGINIADNDGNTPLHLATANGHEDCVKALVYYSTVKNALHVNSSNDFGDTPLHFAATWGYEGIIHTLLENGATVEARNRRKLTPIDCSHNVNVSKMMIQALQESAEKEVGFVQLMPETPPTVINGMLVKEVPVQYITEKEENTQVASYSYKNTYRQIDRLLKAVADGDSKLAFYYLGWENESDEEDNGSGPELCHPLCMCERCQPEQQNKFCLPSVDMVHVNSCNIDDVIPLHVAAMHGHESLVRRFLRRGANVNSKTKSQGCSPLHLACQNNRAKIVQILIERGARVNSKDNRGNTSLHYCCISGCACPARILLQYGASINQRNNKGNSPLHEAAKWNYISLIDLLLSNGAIINCRNKANLTPLQLAQNDDILQVLDQKDSSSSSTIVDDDSILSSPTFGSSIKSSLLT